jgi:hypothetical protein
MDNLMRVSFTIAKDAPAKKGFVPTRTQLNAPTSKGFDLVLDDKIPLN